MFNIKDKADIEKLVRIYNTNNKFEYQTGETMAYVLNEAFEEDKSVPTWRYRIKKATGDVSEDISVTYKEDAVDKVVAEEIVSLRKATPESILRKLGFETPRNWELRKLQLSTWDQKSKALDKHLYAMKATVLPKTELDYDIAGREARVDAMYERIKSLSPKVAAHKKENHSGYMLVIDRSDFHIDKIDFMSASSSLDGRIDDWHSIGRQHYTQFEAFEPGIITIIIPGDLLNRDNYSGTTTKGTPQNNLMDFDDVIDRVVEMIITEAKAFSKVAKVNLIHTPGNHDYQISKSIMREVKAWLHNDENITVMRNKFPRQYLKFGENLVGISHGEEKGARSGNDWASLMAVEQPVSWSDTTNHEWLLQHYHQEKTVSAKGATIYRMPTTAVTGKWSHEEGYVGVRKASRSILYHTSGQRRMENLVIIKEHNKSVPCHEVDRLTDNCYN